MDFPSAFFPRGYPPRVTAGETKTLFSSFHFPKYMRILPLLAFTCLFGSISFAQGQSRASSRPEPAQPAANAAAAGVWQAPTGRKILAPPRWLGLALMSAGSVLTLRSLSMRGGD